MLSVILFLHVLIPGAYLVYRFVRKPNFWVSEYKVPEREAEGIWVMVERVRNEQ